jgi:hypothetical protein
MGAMVQKQKSGAQWLVFSREEQDILDELVKILPKPPFPGLHKQELLDRMGWKAHPLSKREEEWHRIYRVILKSRRMTEARQPDRPMIVNTGTSASEPRYQLVGWTWHDGTPAIFNAPLQLSQMLETRLMPEFRTRATAISELIALKYLVAIADAYDKGDRVLAKQHIRSMSKDTLVIVPVFSLMGQLVGVPYQQARPLPELMQSWTQAIQKNPRYHPFLGKPLGYLEKALKKDWPYIENALTALLERLLPVLLQVYGIGTIRKALDTRAQQIAVQAMLPPGNP